MDKYASNRLPLLSEKELGVFFSKIKIKQAKCTNSNPPTPTHMGSFKGNQPFVKFSVAVRMTEHHESQSQSENFTTPLRSSRLLKKGDEAKFHLEKP